MLSVQHASIWGQQYEEWFWNTIKTSEWICKKRTNMTRSIFIDSWKTNEACYYYTEKHDYKIYYLSWIYTETDRSWCETCKIKQQKC